MTLIYSLLRFVPDPARAESINVGLLVGNEQSGDCRLLLDAGSRRRAHVLSDRGTVDEVWSYVHDLRLGLEQRRGQWRDFRFSGDWLRKSWEGGSNLLQFSPPAPVMARDIDDALTVLSEQLLRTPTTPRAHGFKKSALLAEVRRAYRAAGVEEGNVFEKAVVAGPHHQETFDFAIANGKAVQLAHAWNFRQENLDPLAESVKAWAWTVNDIREKGGEARILAKVIRVPKNVAISVVYAPPTTSLGKQLLSEARHAFKSVKAVVVPESKVSRVAQRAFHLLEPRR